MGTVDTAMEEGGGGMQEKGERGSFCYSLIQCVMGGAMVGVGYTNLNNCNNWAADFLLYAGIIILATYVTVILLSCAKKCAKKDGRISCMEKCGLCFINLINLCLLIADFVTLIWGSIVVFGAYSSWLSEDDPSLPPGCLQGESSCPDYCDYGTFMFAFVLLIIRWVLVPFLA